MTKLNIQVPHFHGFYESLYSYAFERHCVCEKCDELNYECPDCMANFENVELWENFKQGVVHRYVQNFETMHGVKCSNVKIQSPREYNFTTDTITADVEFSDDLIMSKIEDITDFEKWLIENYSTRSGFISFVPTDLTEFMLSEHKWDVIFEHLTDGESLNDETYESVCENYV